MKKYYISIWLVLLLLLSGCGAYQGEPSDSIYSDLVFDTKTFTYTNTSTHDILFEASSPLVDFFILYETFYKTQMPVNQFIGYQRIMPYFLTYVEDNHIDFEAFMALTSKELNEALSSYDIVLTIDDIILFNQLKTIINEMKAADFIPSIRKLTYIEKRLDIVLTRDMIDQLESLQYYFSRLKERGFAGQMKTLEFIDFEQAMNDLLGQSISLDEKESLEAAFNLIHSLYN